jgi:hypothetical protein
MRTCGWYPMKVLCSQEVTSSHLCGVGLCQGTAQASAPQVPWCDLCVWLQQGVWKGMAWSKAIDLYAFSCSSFRKKARNLIETAQRKSQPYMIASQEKVDTHGLTPVALAKEVCIYLEGCMPSNSL